MKTDVEVFRCGYGCVERSGNVSVYRNGCTNLYYQFLSFSTRLGNPISLFFLIYSSLLQPNLLFFLENYNDVKIEIHIEIDS